MAASREALAVAASTSTPAGGTIDHSAYRRTPAGVLASAIDSGPCHSWSEPLFHLDLVSLDEVGVGLGQIDDALDQSDEIAKAASQDRDDDSQNTALDVAEDEAMNAQATYHDAEDTAHDALTVLREIRWGRHEFLRGYARTDNRQASR